jgi:hypothetical protein
VGFPQYIFWDSGPQFAAAEFKEYCKEHHITPLVSSACFPQSNGLAESAIKSAKYLLLKSDSYMDFENRLYEMQNIPSSGDMLSPAEKNFKRNFRTNLPTLDPFFNPIQINEGGRKCFKIGDRVRIQNAVSKRWDDYGSISKIQDSGRSYYIDRDRGRDTFLHNNIFLKLIAPPFALYRAGEEARLSSDSLLLPMQAETSSPMHVPAIAVPAVRRSNCVRKLPVRFAT